MHFKDIFMKFVRTIYNGDDKIKLFVCGVLLVITPGISIIIGIYLIMKGSGDDIKKWLSKFVEYRSPRDD